MAVQHHDPRLLRRLQEVVVVQMVGEGVRRGRIAVWRSEVREGVHAGHTAGQRRSGVEGGEGIVAVLGGGVTEALRKGVRLDLQFGDLKWEKKLFFHKCLGVFSEVKQ